MIEVNELFHSYTKNDIYAVKNVSFEINRGEIFGFLGPSGAGKSTTQGILSGLLKLQNGEIIIEGKARKGYPDKEFYNRIGFGFEIPNVYLKLSGLDNLNFHSRLYDGEKEDTMELLEMVGLGPDAKKKAGTYSKGMKQRLGFARSMINKPDIWFLDEPTMGLDPNAAHSIKEIIRKKKSSGTTIFLTTHNMFVADELCDRVAFIVEGEISAIDTPKKLKLEYGQPNVTVDYIDNGILKSTVLGMTGEDNLTLQKLIGEHEIMTIHSGEPTLEEIFIKLTGRSLE